MGIIRGKIEEHFIKNGLINVLQAGFTKKRRIADNLYMLRYCIENSFRRKQTLFVIAIDFQKAFYSINRSRLIETMMKFKIDSNVIEIIANIYSHDSTELFINNNKQAEIEVTSGIRQGCNGSTILFLLVTYIIIEKLQTEGLGYKDEFFKIAALFFADDGLVFAQSLKETKRTHNILTEVAASCGLIINKQKSNIMICNRKEIYPEIIENISVVENIKYLGIKITDKRECFKEYKNDCILKARRFANMTYSTIANACNKILIGKTFWKSIAMPSFLYAAEILEYTEEELKSFQRIDNQVYRAILELPIYTASSALRSEIGASSSKLRNIKSKILFVKHILENGSNELVREIFLYQFYEQETKFIKKIKKYMEILNDNLLEIENSSVAKLEGKVRKVDDEMWKLEMADKETLRIYKIYKRGVGEISWFDNTVKTKLLIKARTDTLDLNWRGRLKNRDTKCMCGYISETLEHFILHCELYKDVRMRYEILQQPYIENECELMSDILCFRNCGKKDIENRKNLIFELWKIRKTKTQSCQ